mmetsp:Transcript_1260/g.3127  ORF Transcript_1260/g.3127 Transcript_1260/m.3127 type:complete len:311 (+) Transcript_1260:324-1256(+)
MFARCWAVAYDLRQYGIVVRRDDRAGDNSRIHAHAAQAIFKVQQFGRLDVLSQRSRARQESAQGILCIYSSFDGVPRVTDIRALPSVLPVLLRIGSIDQVQVLSGYAASRRNFQHAADQVHIIPAGVAVTGDHLRHGMLHLQTRVHLEEIKVLVLVHQELDSAGALVPNLPYQALYLLYHLATGRGQQVGTGRFLDHLLIPPLDAALSLWKAEYVQIAAVGILATQYLYLDVVRILDVLFHQESVVPEEALGLGGSQSVTFYYCIIIVTDSHALAAPAAGGLDHHRVSDVVGNFHRVLRRGYHPIVTRDR